MRCAVDEFDFRPAANAELTKDVLGRSVGLADFVVLFKGELAHRK